MRKHRVNVNPQLETRRFGMDTMYVIKLKAPDGYLHSFKTFYTIDSALSVADMLTKDGCEIAVISIDPINNERRRLV